MLNATCTVPPRPVTAIFLLLQAFESFVLRFGHQPVGDAVGRKPDRARRKAGHRGIHRSGTDAGLIVDVALSQRRRHQRRLHEDDFHIQSVGGENSPFLGGEQRQGGDGEAGVGNSHFGASFLAREFLAAVIAAID